MMFVSRGAACAGIALVYCATAPRAQAQSAPDSAAAGSVGVAAAARPTDSTAKIQLPSLTLVTAHEVDRMRADQLVKGVAPGQSLLLRSASSLATPPALGNRWVAGELIYPQLLFVRNSGLPFAEQQLAVGREESARELCSVSGSRHHTSVLSSLHRLSRPTIHTGCSGTITSSRVSLSVTSDAVTLFRTTSTLFRSISL